MTNKMQAVLDAIGNLDNVAWCMSREMSREVVKYMRRLAENLKTLKAAIEGESQLAHDTIRITLKTAGYSGVDTMDQFERASALLNMAQELAALTDTHKSDASGEIWERVVTRSWEIALGGVA